MRNVPLWKAASRAPFADVNANGYRPSQPFNGHIETAEQRTIIQQYGDWYTGR